MIKLTRPLLATIILLSVITLLNALIANHVGLSVDEAHYALYGTHLAWSYYDHPPLVGWLQALIIPFSHSDFALRLWPMLFNIGSALVLYRLSITLFPREKPWFGFFCVTLMQGAIIINLLSISFLPQTALIFFGLLTLLFLYNAVNKEKLRDFILLGLSMGLAALSEYTAVFLVIGSGLYIITTKPQLLFNRKLYITATLTFILILPILVWNYQHDWISFSYQKNHVLSNNHWAGKLFLLSQLTQVFLYGFVLCIFGALAICTKPCYWQLNAVRLLVLFTLPCLLFFAYSSGYTFTLPHWTALAWLAVIPLAVRYGYHHWRSTWMKIIVYFSAIYSLILILLIHLCAWQAWFNLPLDKQPLRDLYGWSQAATVANSLHSPILFVSNWTLASRLAWYSQQPVQILGAEGNTQFTLWYGRPQENTSGIVVMPYGSSAIDLVGSHAGQFKHCQLIEKLPIYNHKNLVNSFDFYYCTDYQTK